MLKKFLTAIIILAAIIGIIWYELNRIFPSATNIASSVILKTGPTLQETKGRTNILILGIGGGTHDGPDLTDTIIFASIDQHKGKVNLISIPRDLWVTEVGQNGGKINEAYADGETNNQHKGLIIAKSLVGKITNQPIHYGFRLDFNGFIKAVDLIDGLDVNVDNTLDDYAYPIEGKEEDPCGFSNDMVASLSASIASSSATEWQAFPCRYKHLHVDNGLVHMDGELTLEFSRSRHATGKEGTDFARSHRQQEVIEAIRGKIFSPGTIFNPSKIIGLINIIKDSIDTDIPQDQYGAFIQAAQKLKGTHINTAVVDYGDASNNRSGLLIQPPMGPDYNYLFVLIPRTGLGNYSEIQKYITCELTYENCIVGATQGEILTPTSLPSITSATLK